MCQVNEDLDAFPHDIVRLMAIQIDHEAHAAGVVFLAGVIQPLGSRRVKHSSEYPSGYYHVNRNYLLVILEYLMI